MRTVYFCLFLFIVSGCASKKIVDNSLLSSIVEAKSFRIESDMAHPMPSTAFNSIQNSGLLGPGNSVNNINLIGNSNFLKIEGDSITSYLPFYGERRMGGGYGGGDNVIKFNDVMNNYKAVWDADKQVYNITFGAKIKSEFFDVRLVLYSNMNSYITLNGATRSSISYSGNITATVEN